MRVSERGQITIPKELRDRFGLHRNVEVTIQPTENGLLIQKKPAVEGKGRFAGRGEHPVDRVADILDKDALGKGVSVDEYIEEIRGG